MRERFGSLGRFFGSLRVKNINKGYESEASEVSEDDEFSRLSYKVGDARRADELLDRLSELNDVTVRDARFDAYCRKLLSRPNWGIEANDDTVCDPIDDIKTPEDVKVPKKAPALWSSKVENTTVVRGWSSNRQ